MTKSRGIGRGGKREGAGRKAPDGSAVDVKITACITDEQYDLVMRYGATVSVGLRTALNRLLELEGDAPAPKISKPVPIVKSISKIKGIAAVRVKVAGPLVQQLKHGDDYYD